MTTPTSIQHGSATWWVLQTLTTFGPMSEADLRSMGTHETPEALTHVRALHMVAKNHAGLFEIQPKGRNAFKAAQRRYMKQQITTMAGTRSLVNAGSEDPYDGAELRPFTGRPGAMDAYDMPSLQGCQRVHYRTGEVIA